MKTRTDARERAKELSLEHGDASRVAKHLDREGFGDLLDRSELEAIMAEMESIRSLLPPPSKKTLPRIVGAIAVVFGIVAMSLDAGMPSMRRYSPSGYGLAALILGIFLIVKPSSAKTDI